MRIRKVTKKYSDLILRVPINCLSKLAGDFDGDALNSISLKDMKLVNSYELYNPRTHMVISKNDGLFDNDLNLIKDQLICLHQMCYLWHKESMNKITIKKIKSSKKKDKKKIKMEAKRIVKIKKLA